MCRSALFMFAVLAAATVSAEPATKPQFQAKCPCGWSAAKRDTLELALKDGQAHEKAHKDHSWEIVRTNKKVSGSESPR
jgi:hypothetical protein